MDFKEIKAYIYEQEMIPKLLEKLNCEGIKPEQGGSLYVARLPDEYESRNRRAVQVKNVKGLYSNIRNRDVSGDIFNLVAALIYDKWDRESQSEYAGECARWIEEEFGLEDTGERKKKVITNTWLKEIKSIRTSLTNEKLPVSIMNEYVHAPYQGWIDEGISIKTQHKFDVAMDIDSKRVVFPIHNSDGDLIGVKGRLLDDWMDDDAYKYLYLHACNKSIELFNFHRAFDSATKKRELIVVEGAKSTMLADSLGYYNVVAIEGDSIQPGQIALLLGLPLDVEIILALDADKDEEYVAKMADAIGMRKISYLIDNDNVLGDKSHKRAPFDLGKIAFEKLLHTKKIYRKRVLAS